MKAKLVGGWRWRLARAGLAWYVFRNWLLKPKGSLLKLSGLLECRRLFDRLGVNKWIWFDGKWRVKMIVPPYPSKAYVHMLHRGGFNFSKPNSEERPYIDLAMVGMTRRCSIGSCHHCSERHNIAKEDTVPVDEICKVISVLQDTGAGVIALTGGEPLDVKDRLLEILRRGDKDRSEFQVYTTGKGLTAEYARELKAAGLGSALISLDGWEDESHDKFRQKKGLLTETLNAIKYFTDAGIFPFTNVTLNTELVRTPGGLEKQWRLAHDYGIFAIRYIEPKSCGGYLKIHPDELFNNDDRKIVHDFVMDVRAGKYGDGPMPYYLDWEEQQVIGCRLAAMLLMFVDTVGNVQPCVFLPITFGNILKEPFEVILKRMRAAAPEPITAGCMGQLMSATLKKFVDAGVPPPIPYEMIKETWDDIVAESKKPNPDYSRFYNREPKPEAQNAPVAAPTPEPELVGATK